MTNLLATTRKSGYGEREKDFYPKTSAIAIPVRHAGSVLACLNITFIASVLTPREAAERYLAKMLAAGRRIEESMKNPAVMQR